MTNWRKVHPLIKIINNSLVDLPSPSTLTLNWNFGSLLGFCLTLQLVTGILLAMHYSSDIVSAFSSVDHIMRDVNSGWLLRVVHANSASAFFACLYLHIGRGLYYFSFRHMETWNVGVLILFLVMAAAFMGYVLPWGQMSFWGATVITNLFSAIPYLGPDIVCWLWGGFAVDKPTLTRFFAFHFVIPFILLGAAGVHLLFLHQSGSSSPLGLSPHSDKIPFHPYYSWKDIMGILGFLVGIISLSLLNPWLLGDPENFIEANPLVTPVHIQPEWYFLFAYAILRSIPNKLGGVIALALSVVVLFFMPFLTLPCSLKGSIFSPLSKFSLWILVSTFFLLTWIGARPVEEPYVITGQLLTGVYFVFLLALPSTCGLLSLIFRR